MGGAGGVRRQGSQAPGLDVPAHTVTLHALPSSTPGPYMLPSIPGVPLQLPVPGASYLSPAGTSEGRHVSVSLSDH